MQTEIYLSEDAKALLSESSQPTTTAAEVAPPVVEVVAAEPIVTPQAAPVAEQRKPMTTKAKRSVCKTLVNVFDMAQEMFFTNAADKKLTKRLAENGRNENYLLELVSREANGETDFDQDERNILKLFKKFQRYTDKVPFDEETKDEIVDSLVEYMDEKGIGFSPEMALLVNIVGSLTTNFVALKML
jgi:hypothetical protein